MAHVVAQERPGSTRGAWQGLLAWRARRPVLSLLALAAATRALLLAAAAVGGIFITRFRHPLHWDHENPALRFLARWDAGYYLGMAERGRGYQPESWAFDPGFPAVVRVVHDAFPGLAYVEAATLVNLAALAACVPMLYRLTSRWFDERIAWRATAFLVLVPGSFFLTAAYPEALFMALALGFFLALAQRQWLLAGALASAAAVTRPQGMLLPGILALGIVLARVRGHRVGPTALLALPLSLTLPALDALYVYQQTGDPFFGDRMREVLWPGIHWRSPFNLFGYPFLALQALIAWPCFALLFASLGWALRDAWRRRLDAPLEVYAYSLGLGTIAVSYSDPAAIPRYLLPILASTWALAAWTDTPKRFGWAALVALSFLVAVAALYGAWYQIY